MSDYNNQRQLLQSYILVIFLAITTIILFLSTEIMIEIKKEQGISNLTSQDITSAIGFTLIRLIIPFVLFILTKRLVNRPENEKTSNLDFEKAFTLVVFIVYFYLVIEGLADLFILITKYLI